ncbi:MAG TPA: phospho-N-acetylmuramoyl-pentapeptide-transferase [Candidatus Paceibacterota bacterium]|nr:phospho-N-acetylmuramoyl-pentapeptide-transferase [Candidatus Paceibacterota bacterium]
MTDAFTIFNVVRILIVAALAFFVAVAIEPLWVRILRTYFSRGKEIEKEGAPVFSALHKKKEGTPTMGGFIIWATVAGLTLFFWATHGLVDGFWSRVNWLVRSETYLPLAFLIVAGLVGMADDIIGIHRRGGLGMKARLVLYTAVASLGGWWFVAKLGRDAVNIPFAGDIVIGPLWYFLLFVFAIVATAFSMNETDGLDGLSGGVFLIMFGALGGIAFDQGKMEMVTFIAAIEGALIAFLWFNIYPARFFMGDTGVMALGFVAGGLALLLNVPLLLPLIAIIPFLESLSVLVQMTSKKLRAGKKVFISTPIHHHFEALGWHETQITMRFVMVNAIGAVIGLTIFLADSTLPPLNSQVFNDILNTIFR